MQSDKSSEEGQKHPMKHCKAASPHFIDELIYQFVTYYKLDIFFSSFELNINKYNFTTNRT